ncbi:hypothetical protein F5887DRAFT_935795 [Amanita rubescens]|nr:hypothetical protein F5887DRAFT_935795 [Amanita rubescens]
MNVLYALFLAYHLNTISTYALTVSFPNFTFQDLLATSSNGTKGPVPSACQQVCAPIVPYAIDGQTCTPQACCSSKWEHSYFSCILCAAKAQDITDLSPAQATLDGIYEDCAASGTSLPLLTFPGQSTDRTLPSPSILPSGYSTQSGTVPTTPSGTATSVSASGGASASASSSATISASSSASPTQSASAASAVQMQWQALVLCPALSILSFLV